MKILCRCPHCNGLFEVADYSETGVVCRWCGNDVGTAEYVEADIDEREILNKYLESQKKDNTIGLLMSTPLFLFAIGTVVYKLAMGVHVAWWLWVLGVIAVISCFGLVGTTKEEGKKANMLKKIFADNNYSLDAVVAEIQKLKAKASAIKDTEYDKASELETLSNDLKEMIQKVYSGVSIKQQYAQSDRQGIQAVPTTTSPNVAGEKRIVYIVPPTNCPACNYAYHKGDFDGNATTVACPHCAYEIDVVHKSVRTETQAIIRDYFLGNTKLQSYGVNTAMLVMGLIVIAVCIFVLIGSGFEKFFFSWRVILLFMVSSSIVSYIDSRKKQKRLIQRVRNGFNDIFELEVFVRTHAFSLEKDLDELKTRIVQNLKK